jgi:hypothetical protein
MANAKNQTVSKDFFSCATRMTIGQLQQFLTNVVLNTDPRKLAPIIIWGAPGTAKTVCTELAFANCERKLKTIILSQIGPLDTNGLPHIEKDTENNSSDITRMSPTDMFGRGKFHVFLDELNNCAPSTLAAVQNLLSAKTLGGDDYSDVHIIAACNPPSTNSLANSINFPTISRCINIVIDYTLDDFFNYAMMCGTVHPAISAFHKKTAGRYLQAKWSIYPGSTYEVPEPMENEPFPCPRSWTLASNAIIALSGAKVNSVVDYGLLKPLIEGCVGIAAASEFATTYAYMNRLPDIEKIFDGTLVAKKGALEDNIAVQFLTMMSCINYSISQVTKAASDGTTANITGKNSKGYKLLAGIHHCVRYMGEATAAEFATMTLQSIARAMRDSKLSPEFMNKLLGGVDKDAGLTREDIIRYARTTAGNQSDIQQSIG